MRNRSECDRRSRCDPEQARDRALKAISPSDPDFAALFGVREDTESMHNHIKGPLINSRLRGLGRHRVMINMLA